MNTDKHRWFEMNTWWKAVGIAVLGLAFGALMFGLGMLCAHGHDFALLLIFTGPVFGLQFMGVPGPIVMLLLSPLWWPAMFLCAAWPTRKALYCFIAGECLHFAVVIWVVIGWSYWCELAYDWEYSPTRFIIRSTCFAIFLAGHVFLIWLRLRANRALKNKIP